MTIRKLVCVVGLVFVALNIAHAKTERKHQAKQRGQQPTRESGESASQSSRVTLPPITVTGSQLPTNELFEKNRTGSYLGLTPMETPATVDVITRKEIEKQGLKNLTEVYRSAPGVIASDDPISPGAVSMRGFEDATVFLLNGMGVPGTFFLQNNFDSYNFARVEILKGPASIIHGTGALAGAINIVTRKPDLSASYGDLLLSYGSFNAVRLGISSNQPLSDEVAVQASLSHNRSSGYVDDADSRKTGLTTGLLYKPTEQLSLLTSLNYFYTRLSAPYEGTPLISRSIARDPAGIVSTPGNLVLDSATRYINYDFTNSQTVFETLALFQKAEYQLTDKWTLTNRLGYAQAERFWPNAYFFTFNPDTGLIERGTSIIKYDNKTWSDRFMVSYDGEIGGFRNRFAVGLEYAATDFFTKRRFGSARPVEPFDPFRGKVPPDTPANYDTRANFNTNINTAAVFMEEAFNLTPEWLVVGGLRYAWINLDRRNKYLDERRQNFQDTGGVQSYSKRYESLSWRIGTVYDIFPATALFAQYTKATAPISGFALAGLSDVQYELSTGYAIEAGVKSTFWRNRVTATISVYQIEQEDILTPNPDNPRLTIQGGSRRSRGIELDIGVAITEAWKISANASLIEAEFTKMTNGAGRDLSGNTPRNVPNYTFDFLTFYRLQTLPLTIGASVHGVGDGRYGGKANNFKYEGYTLLNAYAAYETLGGTLTLRGHNLTDEQYVSWLFFTPTQVFLGAPRSFTLSYRVDF